MKPVTPGLIVSLIMEKVKILIMFYLMTPWKPVIRIWSGVEEHVIITDMLL